MSRRHHEVCKYEYKEPYMSSYGGKVNCCCDLRMLTILILIILQFSKKECGEHNKIDNSVLFIIALYFLTCCSPCKKY
jgi:hypothetical protein